MGIGGVMATSSYHVSTHEVVKVGPIEHSTTSTTVQALSRNLETLSHQANKGARTYKKLRRLKGGAGAIAGAFSSDFANTESNMESSSDFDSDAGASSDSSNKSQASHKSRHNNTRPKSRRQFVRGSDNSDYPSKESDIRNSTDFQDENIVHKHRPSSSHGVIRGQTSASDTKVSEDKMVETIRAKGDLKQDTDPEKAVVTVTEKEVEDIGDDFEAPPQQPKKRGRLLVSRATSIGRILSWIVMIISPLFFIALGVCTAALKDKAIDSRIGGMVQQAITVAVSVWPIAFAAIVAQSLRAYASYKAERGLRLMMLEQLINSHSVASALKTPLILKRFDFMAVALVILWALSPLASQSMQRMLSDGALGTVSSANVSYLDTFVDPAMLNGQADSLYGTLLAQPLASFLKPSDPWNNPRVPVFTALNESARDDGWYSINSTEATEDYYSLLGMPIATPIQSFNGTALVQTYNGTDYSATFILQSSYLNASCSPFQNVTDKMNNAAQNYPNITRSNFGGFNLGLVSSNDSTNTNVSMILISRVDMQEMSAYELTTCYVFPVYVESQTICDYSNCSISAVRPLNNTPASSQINYGPDLGNVLRQIVQGDHQSDSGAYTATQLYLANGPGNNTSDNNNNPQPLQQIDQTTFNARFTRLLNTYWQASIAPSAQTGNLNLVGSSVSLTTTIASVTAEDPVYKPSWPWIAVVFFCSTILLLAGVGCAIWDARTLGPDVFGFASTLLRNSKYVKLPDESSDSVAMSGSERARLLADLEVMIQDVKPGSDVGKIALATKGRGDAGREKRLKRGRLYR